MPEVWPRVGSPQVVTGPRIPDEAFRTVVERHREWLATSPGETVEAWQKSSDNVAHSLGLEGEEDHRAFELVSFMLGELREMSPEAIPEQHLYAGVVGIWLGLSLARATGWEPPMHPGG